MRFVIFFTIVFTVYGLANYYVLKRARLLFSPGAAAWRVFLLLFLIVLLAYPIGRIIERFHVGLLTNTLVWIGSLWLAALVYFVLTLPLVDLARFFGSKAGWSGPRWFGLGPAGTTALVLSVAIATVVLIGLVNSRHPTVRHVRVDVALNGRPAPNLPNPLVIALASDIHLGTTLGSSGLERIVDLLNSTDPDLLILAGDIVDEDLGPVLREDMGQKLLQLRSRLGTFAITGNHEYLAGVDRACAYLSAHGVRMLRDETVNLGGLWIVGREDRSIRWVKNRDRVPLETLMGHVSAPGPVLLLDHQPFDLDEAESFNVDLELSGHTHHGQLWPFHLITEAIYEIDWGLLRKARTNYYVSCGAGTWGPPVRTSSRPEVVRLELRFR
jgi:predicted MPP superfamily phosphohydrolase